MDREKEKKDYIEMLGKVLNAVMMYVKALQISSADDGDRAVLEGLRLEFDIAREIYRAGCEE